MMPVTNAELSIITGLIIGIGVVFVFVILSEYFRSKGD